MVSYMFRPYMSHHQGEIYLQYLHMTQVHLHNMQFVHIEHKLDNVLINIIMNRGHEITAAAQKQ